MKKILKWLKWILLFIISLTLLILIPIWVNMGYESIRVSFLTDQEKYSEDIERLEYLIKNEFSGYGVLPGSSSFDENIAQLKELVQQNSISSQTAFNLSIIKAVSAFKDPHSSIYNRDKLLDLRFPYYLDWSDGSFYLLSGTVEKKWLGAEVTKIGNASSREVFNKLGAYTNSPNEAGTAFFMRSFLYSADVLFEEGIIESRDKVDLEVQLNGEKTILSFNSVSRAEFAALNNYSRISEKYEVDELPLYMTNREQNYWYKYLQDENIFYLRYSMCVAQGDIEVFWDEVLDELKKINPDKLVIDVRGNPGGDTQNHSSFLDRLQEDTLTNRYGKIFTLIDRGTGSAAVAFASDMEKMTNTILVGEKTMDKPNTTSDPTFFTLPHSEVTLLLPSLYSLHSYVNDNRGAVNPDIPIVQKLVGNLYIHDEVMDSIINVSLDESIFSYAQLPTSIKGQYMFSTIRNASISQKDSIWYFSVDGLIDAPIYQKDSTFFTKKYGITFMQIDSLGKNITLNFHGKTLPLKRIEEGDISLEKSIMDKDFDITKRLLSDLKEDGALPYYLDRPYFQSRVYRLYNQDGFDQASALNELLKQLFPNDPVASIIDYELYQSEDQSLGQIKSAFPIIGKLLRRYFSVITTDKVMNDDYNAFIGK